MQITTNVERVLVPECKRKLSSAFEKLYLKSTTQYCFLNPPVCVCVCVFVFLLCTPPFK